MKRLFLLLTILFSLSALATESAVIRSYYDLANNFDTSKSIPEQTQVIDSFLKSAKEYLSDGNNRDSRYFATIEQMTKKVKLFQYMYRSLYRQGLLTPQNEMLQDLVGYTVYGALNSSNDDLPHVAAFNDKSYNKALLNIKDIDPALTNKQLFRDSSLKLSDYKLATDEDRVNFIRKMASNTQFKNKLARNILNYITKGELQECRSGDTQCELANVMLTASDENGTSRFKRISPARIAIQINQIIDRARESIDGSLDEYDIFQTNAHYLSPRDSRLQIPTFNGYTVRHTSASQDLPIITGHKQILSQIYAIPGMNFLLNSTEFASEIQKATSPMLRNYCYQESGKDKTCALIIAGGYGIEKRDYFQVEYVESAIKDLYNAVSTSEKQIAYILKKLEAIEAEGLKAPYHRRDFRKSALHKEKRLQKVLFKLIEQSPASFGSALISTPEFIEGVKGDLGVLTKNIDRKRLVDNAKNVALITGLISCAFFTSPVAITAGVVITIYELYAYGSKYLKYKKLKKIVLSELISLQRGTKTSQNYNLGKISARVAYLQDKVDHYKLYSMFAAAGLMSAPITVGSILAKSAKTIDDFVENLRYMEWFLSRLAHSKATRLKFIQTMKVFRTSNANGLIYQLILCRPYLREIISFSERALIHKVHHKIKHPERAHLIERAVSGSGYAKDAVLESKEAKAIAELIDTALNEETVTLFSE